ncbi:MAG: SDR family oxidoreductase [Verrucomicrobiota bacterium]
MSAFEELKLELRETPRRWLVTGAAGFIGSNLLETLLRLGQPVLALDNLATGHRHNLDDVRSLVGEDAWARCEFIEGDIRDQEACRDVLSHGVDIVLHQAALGSVPRSIADPVSTHECNVSGFVNMLTAAKDAGIKRFVYASSSSVYGDDPNLPKVEERTGNPLSPYAASKAMNETYAAVFGRTYGIQTIGLRYFNVFGRRQDPEGAYAAVMPKWFASLIRDEEVFINGDGETSRDFCYIDNVVQANLLAGVAKMESDDSRAYNVACGERTTLNELFSLIRDRVAVELPEAATREVVYRDFRPGDVRHSLADTRAIVNDLGYAPSHSVGEGLAETSSWYVEKMKSTMQ